MDIEFANGKMFLKFVDGREFSVPLANFPRLAAATDEQWKDWQIIGPGIGIRWPQLDEDLSIKKLLDPAAPCM